MLVLIIGFVIAFGLRVSLWSFLIRWHPFCVAFWGIISLGFSASLRSRIPSRVPICFGFISLSGFSCLSWFIRFSGLVVVTPLNGCFIPRSSIFVSILIVFKVLLHGIILENPIF